MPTQGPPQSLKLVAESLCAGGLIASKTQIESSILNMVLSMPYTFATSIQT